MEKLKLHTPDLVSGNVQKLAQLFPSCVTEARDEHGKITRSVDFDQLRQELSDHVVDNPRERYHLDWPGKREAILAANTPIAKTLRPCRQESVGFDTTRNLFIEGDNLDALKLLQETYLNNVDVMYIDPPYNTGKDFLFRDDYKIGTAEYLIRSGQKGEDGHLQLNSEGNGRFHSDWLSMIYPRLRLAWNLLSEDGIIAVTIDDNEVFQLGKVLDEIFGAPNRLACAPWLSEPSGGKEKTGLRSGHEYVLIYSKGPTATLTKEERSQGELNLSDTIGPYRKGRELMKWGGTSLRADRPNQFYELPTPDGGLVLPFRNDGQEGHWRWGKENPNIKLALKDPAVFHWELRSFDTGVSVAGSTQRWVPYEKLRSESRSVGWTTWLDEVGSNAEGTRELKALFGEKPFDTPKPTSLIKWVIQLHDNRSGIVLDFFAGSCSTAHAVFAANVEDGGDRRFIAVQLAEECAEGSVAAKLGFRTISALGRERIRKAGTTIKADVALSYPDLDIGFRALTIDTSNMKDVYYSPDDTRQAALLSQVDNIKGDRTPEDLLFQVLVDWGVDLALPVAQETIDGRIVFFVDGNALAACFDPGISDDFVKEIAKRKPLRAVFRDSSYGSDSVKINVEQIFKLLSPSTEIRSI